MTRLGDDAWAAMKLLLLQMLLLLKVICLPVVDSVLSIIVGAFDSSPSPLLAMTDAKRNDGVLYPAAASAGVSVVLSDGDWLGNLFLFLPCCCG